MFTIATANATTATTICDVTGADFSDFYTVMKYINATWYCQPDFNSNCSYYATVQNETNLTDAEMVAFYNSATQYSFGWALLNRTQTIS